MIMTDVKILMLAAIVSYGLIKLSIKIANSNEGLKLLGAISLMVFSGFAFVICVVGLITILLGEMLT